MGKHDPNEKICHNCFCWQIIDHTPWFRSGHYWSISWGEGTHSSLHSYSGGPTYTRSHSHKVEEGRIKPGGGSGVTTANWETGQGQERWDLQMYGLEGIALFSGWMWCLYSDRRCWMRASFGKWPERLQPTVRNCSNELLSKRERSI